MIPPTPHIVCPFVTLMSVGAKIHPLIAVSSR